MIPKEAPAKVAILLCTSNGSAYLRPQLDSFAAQSYKHWIVWASDDGSQDDTRSILEAYRLQWGADRLFIQSGPLQGFAANFLSLSCKSDIEADYYAYSDQDDIWEDHKLERAIDWIQTVPQAIPALYCSRTQLVDERNQTIGFSPLFTKPPSFRNALVQNIGGGNTMVFNKTTCRLLRAAGKDIKVVSHDWWVYMIVSGCAGKVFYDDYPSVRYRQHAGNIVGCNSSWLARGKRLKMLFQGRLREWINDNIQALNSLRAELSPAHRKTFDQFVVARNQDLWPRLMGLKQSGIYRQTLFGNLALMAAAIFKKI